MKIGFIGLGIMGESMCENIVKKHNMTEKISLVRLSGLCRIWILIFIIEVPYSALNCDILTGEIR